MSAYGGLSAGPCAEMTQGGFAEMPYCYVRAGA